MKRHAVAVFAVALSVLASCQSTSTPRTLPDPTRPATVEGAWSDPNGLVSTFQGGTFSTRTTDGSNAVMASGTYTSDPSGLIQISFYSTMKKTTSRANCQLVSANQLNCTSDTGAQFSLNRRTDMPVNVSVGGAPMGVAQPMVSTGVKIN